MHSETAARADRHREGALDDDASDELRAIWNPEKAASSFRDFIAQAWPLLNPGVALEWGWHIDAIAEHLMAVSAGQILNLVITVPPGTTKTTIVSVMWPAWEWIAKPWIRWLCAANEDGLVTRDAVACRRLIESQPYRDAWGDRFLMTTDQNVKLHYENSRRGYRSSTTVGSNVTGKKGDILIVDDPNDAKKVHSAAERKKVHDWWDHGFYSRVNHFKTARRVVIGQRTHKDDLQGHLVESGEFIELRIPEEFETKRRFFSPIGWTDPRDCDGELLRPTRFGPEEVRLAKRRLGSVGYAQQHQQRGTSPEGRHFKEQWFRPYRLNVTGDGYLFPDGSIAIRDDLVVYMVIDPATGKGATGDLTAVGVFAVHTQSGRVLVLDMVSRRMPIAGAGDGVEDLMTLVRRLARQWGCDFAAVEADGFQSSVAEKVEATGLSVREVSHEGKGKLTRAQSAIIAAEAGDVWVSSDADWVGPFLEELCAFTGIGAAEVDNQVDVLSYAIAEAERIVPAACDEPFPLGRKNTFYNRRS
jgi:predicted phage terminase large subunit-like protein